MIRVEGLGIGFKLAPKAFYDKASGPKKLKIRVLGALGLEFGFRGVFYEPFRDRPGGLATSSSKQPWLGHEGVSPPSFGALMIN